MTSRKRKGHNRINAHTRARLRRGLLRDFGDGVSAPCQVCGDILTDETMTIDRYPVCGWDGGRYLRNNIRPLCRYCNEEDGAQRVRERLGLHGPSPLTQRIWKSA